MKRCWGTIVLSGILWFPLALSAQENPVEFGIDGGVSILMPDDDDDENLTLMGFPNRSASGISAIRFGFFVSPRVAIEPAVAVGRWSAEDCSATVLDFFPSVLYHLADYGRVALPYVRAGAGVNRSSWSCDGDDGSETQFGVGGGIGIKVPVARTAFIRLEAGYEKWLEKGDEEDWEDFIPGYGALRLSVGISAILN